MAEIVPEYIAPSPMDTAIFDDVEQRFKSGMIEYTPDYADSERMKRLQEHLAGAGITTIHTTLYTRGFEQSITSRLRRIQSELPDADVIRLDDYR